MQPKEKTIQFLTMSKTKNGVIFYPNEDIWRINEAINRNLIQQGITMLQEGLVTYLLNKANEEYRDRDLRKEFSTL